MTSDDYFGNRDHLGIDLAGNVAELGCPHLVGGAQCDQHHTGVAWLDQDGTLARQYERASD